MRRQFLDDCWRRDTLTFTSTTTCSALVTAAKQFMDRPQSVRFSELRPQIHVIKRHAVSARRRTTSRTLYSSTSAREHRAFLLKHGNVGYQKGQVLLELLLSARPENIMTAACCLKLSKHSITYTYYCMGVTAMEAAI